MPIATERRQFYDSALRLAFAPSSRPYRAAQHDLLVALSVISSAALLWFCGGPHARPALRVGWPRCAYSPRPLSHTAVGLPDRGRGAGSAEAQTQVEAPAWPS